jgi:hypothetical protein
MSSTTWRSIRYGVVLNAETRPQKCAAGFCVGSYAEVGALPLNVSDRADGFFS